MTPLAHFLPYGLVFWVVFFWAYLPEFAIVRRAERGAAEPPTRARPG